MSETDKKIKPEHETRRSGFQSSEFLLTLATVAVSAILPMLSDAASNYVLKTPYAFVAPAIAAAGYAISRAIVKKSRNDASATVQAAKTTDAKCDDAPRALDAPALSFDATSAVGAYKEPLDFTTTDTFSFSDDALDNPDFEKQLKQIAIQMGATKFAQVSQRAVKEVLQ